MAARNAKCINFGLCPKADAREVLEVSEGAEFVCPECGKELAAAAKGGSASSGGGPLGRHKVVALGGLGAVVLLGVYLLLPADEPVSPPDPGPVVLDSLPPINSDSLPPEPIPPNPQPELATGPTEPQLQPEPGPIPPNPQPSPELAPGPTAPGPKTPDPRPSEKMAPGLMPREPTSPAEPPPDPARPDPAPRDPVPPVAKYEGPSFGAIVWEGDPGGTALVVVEEGVSSSGRILSGRLPGVPVVIQPSDEKRVAIAAAPGPDSKYRRLVFRVRGKGQTRVTLSWSLAQ
jgi:hypothetical protein